ncbi:MAG: acyl--CoA ligase [Magnetococcales bacterium]|nr:acyl--CoA ligase [Magnetococcales bacterium]
MTTNTGMPFPTTGEHFLAILKRHAHEHPHRPALVADEQTLDYGTLWSWTEGIAQELAAQGLQRGQCVFLAMEPSLSGLLFHLGLLRLGVVTALLDPGLSITQWSNRVQDLAPTTIIAPSPILAEIHKNTPWQGRSIDLSSKVLENLTLSSQALPECPNTNDPVLILGTTGTTGPVKYVLLTLGNISAATSHINATMGIRDTDVEILTLPLHHSFGLGRLRCGLAAGACSHLVAGRFRPERLLKAVKGNHATLFAQVPAGIRLLLALGNRVRPWLEGIRLVEIGSAPLEMDEKKRLMDLLPQAKLWHHYGLTEASRSLFLEYHDALQAGCLHALGRPAPGVELQLSEAKDGEPRELLIRGPHVSPGYCIPGGRSYGVQPTNAWLATGDLVRLDERGTYYHVGRSDDVINLGGFKVHPQEIESVLAACPGIADVAVAFRGGQLVAFIQNDSTFQEQRALEWLQKHLEPYKHPQCYRLLDRVPRTESGKLLRRLLPD